MDELKPCPFCGGQAALYNINGKKQVRCRDCMCRTTRFSLSNYVFRPNKTAAELAVEAWNKRVTPGGDK